MELSENFFNQFGAVTCAFANLPQITKAVDVEQLFPWLPARMSLASNPNAAAIYKDEQKLLKKLLDRLIELKGDKHRAVEFRQTHLNRVAMENPVKPAWHQIDEAQIRFGPRGFELDVQPKNTHGVKIVWLLFFDAALTLEPHGRYLRSRRVTHCVWEQCPDGRYFIGDLPGKKGGTPRLSHKGHSAEQEKIRRKRRREGTQ